VKSQNNLFDFASVKSINVKIKWKSGVIKSVDECQGESVESI